MRRALATMRVDFEVQARNGLVLATAAVLFAVVAALAALPPTGVARLLPAVALQNLGVTGFFFSIAMALLERSEGSRAARLVTPLRGGEYLAARVATLATLAVAQHLVLGIALTGFGLHLLALLAGVTLACATLALAGFALVAGKDSLGAALLPAVPWLALLLAPMAADVLDWRHPLLWLHPIQGGLVLMRAAVAPAGPAEVGLALVTGLGWAGVAFAVAHARYERSGRGSPAGRM
jgi:fluoroquinolone transport system permease protein